MSADLQLLLCMVDLRSCRQCIPRCFPAKTFSVYLSIICLLPGDESIDNDQHSRVSAVCLTSSTHVSERALVSHVLKRINLHVAPVYNSHPSAKEETIWDLQSSIFIRKLMVLLLQVWQRLRCEFLLRFMQCRLHYSQKILSLYPSSSSSFFDHLS